VRGCELKPATARDVVSHNHDEIMSCGVLIWLEGAAGPWREVCVIQTAPTLARNEGFGAQCKGALVTAELHIRVAPS
jgi:predicted lipoprotein